MYASIYECVYELHACAKYMYVCLHLHAFTCIYVYLLSYYICMHLYLYCMYFVFVCICVYLMLRLYTHMLVSHTLCMHLSKPLAYVCMDVFHV